MTLSRRWSIPATSRSLDHFAIASSKPRSQVTWEGDIHRPRRYSTVQSNLSNELQLLPKTDKADRGRKMRIPPVTETWPNCHNSEVGQTETGSEDLKRPIE